MDTRLKNRLRLVAKRLYLFHLGGCSRLFGLLAATVGWGLLQTSRQSTLPSSVLWTWIGVTVAATLIVSLWRRSRFADLQSLRETLKVRSLLCNNV